MKRELTIAHRKTKGVAVSHMTVPTEEQIDVRRHTQIFGAVRQVRKSLQTLIPQWGECFGKQGPPQVLGSPGEM